MRMTPILRTERLVLRPPQASDAEDIVKNLDDFDVAGNLARVPFPYRLADAQAWLMTRRHIKGADQANFAILHEGAYMGQVGFHPGPKGPIIGYWLGKPFWGKGFMSEAAYVALDWFFGASGMTKIHSGVFVFNRASLAVQNKLGFTEIGRSTLRCLAREAEVEHIDTDLTRERFRSRSLHSAVVWHREDTNS